MLENRVVTGKVIDIRDDKVLTVHGDMVSTFDMRYYAWMNEEPLPLTDSQATAASLRGETAAETDEQAEPPGSVFREWGPLLNFITAWRKSANRA